MNTIFKNKTLTVLFVSTFLFFTNEALFLPTLPLYLSKAGYSHMEVGIILGAFALGVLLFRPLSGFVTDRKGRKPALFIGVFIFATAPVFYFFSTSFVYLLMIRFFHGLGITFYTTAYPTLITDIVPDSKRGEILGHIATATTLSFVLGPFVGVTLYNGFGFQALLFTCIGIGSINLAVISFIEETRIQSTDPAAPPQWSEALKNRAILVSSGIQVVIAVIFGGVMTFLPILLTDKGLNAAIFFMVESLMILFVRITAGHFSDRLGRGPVFFYSFLIMLCGVFLISKITTLNLLILTGLLVGMGSALCGPSLCALVADESDPSVRGMVYGLFYGAFDFGVVLAGVFLGYVADKTSLESMFSLTAFAGVMALALFAVLIQKGITNSLSWTLKFHSGPFQ